MPDILHRVQRILEAASAPRLPRSPVDPEIVLGDGSPEPPQRPADAHPAAGRYEPAAAPAPVTAPAPARSRPVDVDENLRETNQRLRANLRAAEAMLALRDGVSVHELVVPWPKQTPRA